MAIRIAAVTFVLAVCATAFVATGCDERSSAEPVSNPRIERARVPEYEALEFDDGGSIAGRVRWEGERPEPELLPVRLHREQCGASQPSMALRVSERRGVADTVITLSGIRRGEPLVAASATLAREGCRFVPHVQVVTVGTHLSLVNRDPVLHNAHAFDERGESLFDLGLPEAGSVRERVMTAPGLVRVVCDAGHTFEHAYVQVLAHPYGTVTGPDGSFRLSNVPPGQYVLTAWHEGWRQVGTERGRPRYTNPVVMTRTVSVSVRQETQVDFTLSEQAGELAGEPNDVNSR